MRKSEVKVADYVIQNSDHVIHMRIVDLAQEALVSEPTIVRFCRAIQCNGFQEFKVKLAQDLAIANNIGQFAIVEDDCIEDICKKIADTTIQRLHQVKDQLLPEQVGSAASAISQARRLEFYGFGASAAVATDALHKFFSPANCHRLLQRPTHAGHVGGQPKRARRGGGDLSKWLYQRLIALDATGSTLRRQGHQPGSREHPDQSRSRFTHLHQHRRRHRSIHADDLTHRPPHGHRHAHHRRQPAPRPRICRTLRCHEAKH